MVLKYDKLKNWAIVLFEINQFYFVSSVWNFSMPEQSNGVTFALIVPSFMLILSMLSTAQKFNTSVFKYIITAVCCSRTKHFNIQWKRRQFWLAVFIAYNCSWSFVSSSLLLFLYVLALHMKIKIQFDIWCFILFLSLQVNFAIQPSLQPIVIIWICLTMIGHICQ